MGQKNIRQMFTEVSSDIVVTAERPDLVRVNKDIKDVQIYDNRIKATHHLKIVGKYSALCADIFQARWICHLNGNKNGPVQAP